MNNRHLRSLDGLRGLAALWVVLFHSWAGQHIKSVSDSLPGFIRAPIFEYGYLGVPVFFVLSGFVIPYSSFRADRSKFEPIRFMNRRWRRLSPPYYAALVFTVAVGAIEYQIKDGASDSPPEPWIFVAHLLYVQDFLNLPRIGVFFWTLALEMQFYLLFALMAWVSAKSRNPHVYDVLLGGCLIVSVPWALGWTSAGAANGIFIDNWFLFLVGGAVYQSTTTHYWKLPAASYIFLLLVAAFGYGQIAAGAGAISAILIAVIAFDVVAFPARILSTRWVVALGTVSFSLYLIHNAVAGPIFFIIYKVPGPTILSEILGLVIVTVLQIALAWIWYLIFERSAIAWSRRLRGTSTSLAPAVSFKSDK